MILLTVGILTSCQTVQKTSEPLTIPSLANMRPTRPELYLNAYEHDDHATLAEFLGSNYSDVKWIVSYDVCLPVADLYSGFRCSEQILNYSANTSKKGSEFVFYSNKITLPSDIVLRTPYAIISQSNIA